jgi:hypothetical protein
MRWTSYTVDPTRGLHCQVNVRTVLARTGQCDLEAANVYLAGTGTLK